MTKIGSDLDGAGMGRDDFNKPHLPGDPGIWVMISGDMIIFSLLFGTFAFYRGDNLAAYHRGQGLLSQPIGLTNTLILLTSSLFVARSVRAAERGHLAVARHGFLSSILLGMCFIILKTFEWTHLISLGFTLNTSMFFTFYYMMTGIHLAHVIIGLSVLVWVRSRSSPASPSEGRLIALETGATFWHLVDLLWIVLFAILYVAK